MSHNDDPAGSDGGTRLGSSRPAPSSCKAAPAGPSLESLGPGVVGFSQLSTRLVGDTLYLGSRNLDPTRVVGFHLPTGKVHSVIRLGNGKFVQGLAADGTDILYAGVTHAASEVNLYRCDLRTGKATGVASVPDLFIRALAVDSSGAVYLVGRPVPFGDGPPIYRFDPVSGELALVAVPEPDCDEGFAIDVTDTTIYYGCGSRLSSRQGQGVFTIDRASGRVDRVAEVFVNLHALRLLDGVVAVGAPSALGVLDLADDRWTEVPADHPRAVCRRGDDLLFVTNSELRRLNLTTSVVSSIGKVSEIGRRPEILGNTVVGAAPDGRIETFDLNSGQAAHYRIDDVRGVAGPMLGNSLAAGGGVVYVGGTSHVAVHDPCARSVTNIQTGVGTEVKDMTWVDGAMYMGVYARGEIWKHDLRTGDPAEPVASLPDGQVRPQSMAWDAVNELLAIGARNDSAGGGALCWFDPATKAVTARINPLGARQSVSAVAAGVGLLFIAGSGDSDRTSGDVAAWDPVIGEQVWRIKDAVHERIESLVVDQGRIFGFTQGTTFFVIDTSGDPRVVHHETFGDLSGANAQLIMHEGHIYGASESALFRIDPSTYQLEVIIPQLDGQWFNGPHVAVDRGHLYTLRGRDLIQVTMHRPRGHHGGGSGTSPAPTGPMLVDHEPDESSRRA